jgi:hypothetical protein
MMVNADKGKVEYGRFQIFISAVSNSKDAVKSQKMCSMNTFQS